MAVLLPMAFRPGGIEVLNRAAPSQKGTGDTHAGGGEQSTSRSKIASSKSQGNGAWAHPAGKVPILPPPGFVYDGQYPAPPYPSHPMYYQYPDLRYFGQPSMADPAQYRADADAAAARGLYALRQLPMFDPHQLPNKFPYTPMTESAPQVPDAGSDFDDEDEEDQPQLGSYDQHASEGPTRKRHKNRAMSPRDRKEYHKTAERKRRTKINDLVGQLHELLPDSAAIPCQKPTVLLHTISYIRKMRSEFDRLKGENASLANELSRVRKESDHASVVPCAPVAPAGESEDGSPV